MPGFHVADLTAQGELELQQEYQYDDLAQLPGTADLIGHLSGEIWKNPQEFNTKLGYDLNLRFSAPAPTAAIASLFEGKQKILSLSLLLTGINADADRLTVEALQTHLLRELHDTPFEPGFSLLSIKVRPVVASLHVALPSESHANALFALTDRCLAAAYFRYHRLV